ncbi:MAG: glycoside hydrolase family 44 protein, partial [Patescibacteria group bacterium]
MNIKSVVAATLSLLLPITSFAAGLQPTSTLNGDWGTGFCSNISIKNTDATSATWSTLTLPLSGANISNFWNGVFTKTSGGYTIAPEAWNSSIAGNATIDLGYCADGTGRPGTVTLGGQSGPVTPPVVVVRPQAINISNLGLNLSATVNDWGTGFCRTITVKNTKSTAIKNWKFTFDTKSALNLWSGKMTKSGDTVTVTPEAWNGSLASGANAELGFCATGTDGDRNWTIISVDDDSVPTPTPINGSCGSDNGKTLSSTPTALCSAGNASQVNGNGPWSWSCQGSNGGTTASCSANKTITPPTPVNGVCGSDNGKTLSSTPTALCSAGNPSSVTGTGPWSWSCLGQNGGTNSSCTATAVIVTPPGTPLTINVDANKNRTAISPYIYGRNFGSGNAENFAAVRLGGNRLSGYNWENNASNAGSDWYNSSDSYLGDSNVPGKTITDFHDANQQMGAPYSLVTLQMAGYVARDKNGPVYANETAPSARWDEVIPAKGSAFSLTPDLGDHKVYMDELVNMLSKKYGKSTATGGIRGYALDNEPGLWVGTHSLIHPLKTTIAEMIKKSVALSKAVKAVDAGAEIFGAVTYGFSENYNLQDAPDWDNYKNTYATYLDAYLANLKQASTVANKRLLDVLDIHWYPEAQGATLGGQKIRITENNTDPGVAKARMQAPRSLWDPTYIEDSWIGQWQASTAFPLIPKLQASINKYYPGTKLAITEFDYGANGHISGGIATADALGIYGKYGVYFSSYWGDVNGYVS